MIATFLVECTIRRKAGTHPFMFPTDRHPDGKQYHFQPRSTDDPRHVAEVDCIVHLRRFLECEGFQIVDAPAPLQAPAATVGKEGGEAGGGASLPNPADQDAFPEDMDALRVLFEAEMGRRPSHRALRETMIAQIKAMRDSKGEAASQQE